jgi:hypothetical protein
MTDTTADACTAYIVNEHSGGTHHCALEAGHHDPEFGTDHAGPVDDNGVRYRWGDDAIGAVPHAASAVVPAADRAALRDRIRLAIARQFLDETGSGRSVDELDDAEFGTLADAVLSVLPAPADRAAALTEAADKLAEFIALHGPTSRTVAGWTGAEAFLRRLATESAVVDRVAAETPPAETHSCEPATATYYCPTSRDTESDCHGGFTVCCDRPDLHRPAVEAQPGKDTETPQPKEA